MTAALSLTDQWNAAPVGPVTGESHTATNYRADLGQLTENEVFLFNRLLKPLLGSFKTFAAGDIDTGTDQITIAGHGIPDNTVARYAHVGATPMSATGMVAPDITVPNMSITTLYIQVVDADTIELAITSGGSAIDITASGDGDHYLFLVPDSLDALMCDAFTTAAGNTIPAGPLRITLAAYYAALSGCTFTGNLQIETTGDFTLKGTKRVTYASRGLTRYLAMNASTAYPTQWARIASTRGAWANPIVGGTLDIHLEDLPSGNVLTAIGIKFDPAGGHGGLPTMPVIELFKIAGDGTETSLGSQTDTSPDVGTYEALHEIQITGLSHTIDRSLYRYVLQVTGESGGNFVANAKVNSVFTTFTITTQPEA